MEWVMRARKEQGGGPLCKRVASPGPPPTKTFNECGGCIVNTEPEGPIYWDGNDLGKHYAVVPALVDFWMVGRRTLNPHTRRWSSWCFVKSKALPVSKDRAKVEAAFKAWRKRRGLRTLRGAA